MPVQTHVTVLFIGTNVKHLYDAINGSFLELTNKLNNGRAWVFGANEVGETRGQPVLVGILGGAKGTAGVVHSLQGSRSSILLADSDSLQCSKLPAHP